MLLRWGEKRDVVTVSLAHFLKREGSDFGKVRCNTLTQRNEDYCYVEHVFLPESTFRMALE